MSRANPRAILAAVALLAYAGLVVYSDGLGFERYRDERQFWEAVELFSSQWPPGPELLRSYPEPMTPGAFLLWSAVDVVLDIGPAGPRAVNLLLSIGIIALIGGRAGAGWAGLLCGVGLLLYPYYLPLSIHMYTDVPAAFFAVLGFWLHARGRPVASALALAAAISTRQYMVAFPAALAAAELAWRVLPPHGSPGRWREAFCAPVVAPTLAMLSYGGWILFFGGLAPEAGLAKWPRHETSLAAPDIGHGLYFLSCIGAYFVIVEAVLFRRGASFRELGSRSALLVGAAVALAFVVFFPFDDELIRGAMNRAALTLLPAEQLGPISGWLRGGLYAALAWLAVVRFARFDLVAWILAANFTLMTISFEGWEKYALSAIACLWLIRSMDPLDAPFALWERLRAR